MFYLQLAIGIVSLLVGFAQIAKEGTPLVQKALVHQQQVAAQQRATQQAQMNIQYHYRGNDNIWRYYSDATGRYWTRVNVQGVVEYCQNHNGNPL
jgi:hypothetical protein